MEKVVMITMISEDENGKRVCRRIFGKEAENFMKFYGDEKMKAFFRNIYIPSFNWEIT